MIPRWRTLAFVASLVVLGLAGFVAWRLLVARPEVPRGVIAVSGRIEGDGAPVATKTAGRILDIAVREGDWIAAGQVVAALGAARSDLASPAARSAQAASVKTQLLRAEAEIAAAQAEAARARAGLDEARANRLDFTVFAPFNGVVAARTAEPGKEVKVGTPVITLVKLSQVYFRAAVPAGQIGRVRVGQPARVYLDGAAAKAIDARVSGVDPEVGVK